MSAYDPIKAMYEVRREFGEHGGVTPRSPVPPPSQSLTRVLCLKYLRGCADLTKEVASYTAATSTPQLMCFHAILRPYGRYRGRGMHSQRHVGYFKRFIADMPSRR